MAQDLNGTVAALSQGAGAPLGHPAPVQTLHLPAVTVLGQDGWRTPGGTGSCQKISSTMTEMLS